MYVNDISLYTATSKLEAATFIYNSNLNLTAMGSSRQSAKGENVWKGSKSKGGEVNSGEKRTAEMSHIAQQ
jgi:hypothetical protein